MGIGKAWKGINVTEMKNLVSRVSSLESAYNYTIPSNTPYVVRLDGVAFRNFTHGMIKPFDYRLTRAMLLTTKDLMERCAARSGYCHSDEISLLFAGESSQLLIMYGGRIQKIVSVLASLAAARFNWHLSQMSWKDPPVSEQCQERVCSGTGLFDARIFTAPDEIMAGDALYWRHAIDGRRNSINMAAFSAMGHDKMMGQSLQDVMNMLEQEYGINAFQRYPPSAMYGALLKKKRFPHVGKNPLTGEMVPTIRNRIEARSFDWSEMNELTRTEMLMSRLWEDHHPASLEILDFELDSNPNSNCLNKC